MRETAESSDERGEFAIRMSFLTVTGTTRAQAERAADSIQRHAEKLAKVSHTYDREVASEADDIELSERELYEQ